MDRACSAAPRRWSSRSVSATASSCSGRRATSRTTNFVGIEVHRPGVGRLMNALAAHNVNNVRLYNHDAVDVLEQLHRHRRALDEVRIYFPDPWPKKRQQKRRLIQPDFVALLADARAARRDACIWRPIGRTMRNKCSRRTRCMRPLAQPARRGNFAPRPRDAHRNALRETWRASRPRRHGTWSMNASDDLQRRRPNKNQSPR